MLLGLNMVQGAWYIIYLEERIFALAASSAWYKCMFTEQPWNLELFYLPATHHSQKCRQECHTAHNLHSGRAGSRDRYWWHRGGFPSITVADVAAFLKAFASLKPIVSSSSWGMTSVWSVASSTRSSIVPKKLLVTLILWKEASRKAITIN